MHKYKVEKMLREAHSKEENILNIKKEKYQQKLLIEISEDLNRDLDYHRRKLSERKLLLEVTFKNRHKLYREGLSKAIDIDDMIWHVRYHQEKVDKLSILILSIASYAVNCSISGVEAVISKKILQNGGSKEN